MNRQDRRARKVRRINLAGREVESYGLHADFWSDFSHRCLTASWPMFIAGSVAAWLIVTRLMTLSFVWQAGSAAGVVAAALIVTVGLGLAGTLLALNQKPASVLRNL
jgi:predicted lysophospholipase L1 biosynthesis ABC-type transport system permease subunit